MSDTLSYDHYCLLQDSENEASVIKLYNDRLAVKFAKKKKTFSRIIREGHDGKHSCFILIKPH